MAASRSVRPPRSVAPPVRPRAVGGRSSRPVPRVAGLRLRWDRIGRIALVLVLVAVVGLYIGPAWSYFSTWREAGARRGELHRLRAENARLLAEQRSLSQPSTLVRQAREMGMVRRGERPFVVTGLPRG